MTSSPPPIRFDPAFETIGDDEDAVQHGLTEAMLAIQRRTHVDTGYAHRAVHAKAHGYVRARFEVLADLDPALAQGLYAAPATYDAGCASARRPATCWAMACRRRAASR